MPGTVLDFLERMRSIDAALGPDDGVRVFHTLYLAVTERIYASLQRGGYFRDDATTTALDLRFAGLWLGAYDAAAGGRPVPTAWAPLFSSRHRAGLLPVQHALAGMNTHIEHDLPLAVVSTCEARGTDPDDPTFLADYLAVNELLASQEAAIRRSFLDDVERAVDDRLAPAAHLVASWSIERARDAALLHARTAWELRRTPALRTAYLEGLARTVGMGSRLLLTPVVGPGSA